MKYIFSLIIFSFVFLFATSAYAADLTAGLIGYWPFDEASGSAIIDSSGRGYNETIIGNPARVAGKIGRALDFDGDLDAVALSDIPTPPQYTIAFWMLTGTGGNAAIDRVVVGKNSAEYELRINAPNSALSGVRGALIARTNTKTLEYPAINFYDSDHIGVWHHIAYSVDTVNGMHTLYVNGAKAISAATMLNPVDTATPLWIGANPQGKDDYFVGTIDEVRFYDRVLTTDDILALSKLKEASVIQTTAPVPAPSAPTSTPLETQVSTTVPAPYEGAPVMPLVPITDPIPAPLISGPDSRIPLVSDRILSSYRFTRNLTVGSAGEDVRQLQIFLNDSGFLIAQNGAGSRGQESAYFGLLTKSALARYQEFRASSVLTPFGLTQGTGYFGARTRESVHGELATPSFAPPHPSQTITPGGSAASAEALQQQIDSLIQQVQIIQALLRDRQ